MKFLLECLRKRFSNFPADPKSLSQLGLEGLSLHCSSFHMAVIIASDGEKPAHISAWYLPF